MSSMSVAGQPPVITPRGTAPDYRRISDARKLKTLTPLADDAPIIDIDEEVQRRLLFRGHRRS